MEEDDTVGRNRCELRQEKERLTGFSKRLAVLVGQINIVDSVFEYLGGQSSFADEQNNTNYRRPSSHSENTDMVMDDDDDESGGTITVTPNRNKTRNGAFDRTVEPPYGGWSW
jgi:hypothetical protein